jgi:ferredoxin
MAKRKIIEINEKKCNGCGQCIPNCPEGALQIIDGKARLVSDLFCDGLGACIGHCPQGAIRTIEREAQPYDERKVMANIIKQGDNTIKAHLEHLRDHAQHAYLKEAIKYLEEKGMDKLIENGKTEQESEDKPALPCGCPGSMMRDMRDQASKSKPGSSHTEQDSELRQWPVQWRLVPPNAPYFDNADLLITADCVPFASANFHKKLLKDRSLVIGCPKLDDIESFTQKLAEIFKSNTIKSITVAIMEVPCCMGLYVAVEKAIEESQKNIPMEKKVISISGNIQ